MRIDMKEIERIGGIENGSNRDIAEAIRILKLNDLLLPDATPDLLAACNEFVRKVDAGEARSTRSYEQMKAAIAKATGAA